MDGLRSLAILFVLVGHGRLEWTDTPLDRLLTFATGGGWLGVDLFSVLSGFLITGILCDSKGGPGYFRNFYARRILRIFPLYYALLFLVLVVLPTVLPWEIPLRNPWPDQLWYWAYLSNVHIGLHGGTDSVLGISWSLAIEEQFHLLWPALV